MKKIIGIFVITLLIAAGTFGIIVDSSAKKIDLSKQNKNFNDAPNVIIRKSDKKGTYPSNSAYDTNPNVNKENLVQMDYSCMCDWVDGYDDHGPAKTEFNQGDNLYFYVEVSGVNEGDVFRTEWIQNNQVVLESSFNPVSWSGSGCLWNQKHPSIVGSWFVKLYCNDIYMGSGPTFTILDSSVILEYSCMCDWVDGYDDHGPAKTEFDLGDEMYFYAEVNNVNQGDIFKTKWEKDGQVLYESQWDPIGWWGSGCLWNWWTPSSAGSWLVKFYCNDNYVGSGPSFTVSGGSDPVQLDYSCMCDWVNDCDDHGPAKTQFDLGDTIYFYGDVSNVVEGDLFGMKCLLNGDVVYEDDWNNPISWSGSGCLWNWWTPSSAGSWLVKLYCNGDYVGSGPSFTVSDDQPPDEQTFTAPFYDDNEIKEAGLDKKYKTKTISYEKLNPFANMVKKVLDLNGKFGKNTLLNNALNFIISKKNQYFKNVLEEPIPTHPFADAIADKTTGRVYVKADTYLSLPGKQAATAEAHIIGCDPNNKHFTVSRDGNYRIKFNYRLTSGIVWIKCDPGGHVAAGSASIGGFLYEKGKSGADYLKTCADVIYAHTDYGDNDYHHNFINDPKDYSCSLTCQLDSDKEYFFLGCLFMDAGCEVLLIDLECKAQGELDMNLNSVVVSYVG